MSTPIRRTRSGCCARATSGHAAALPIPAMNSRRRIRDLLLIGGAYRAASCKETGVAMGAPWARAFDFSRKRTGISLGTLCHYPYPTGAAVCEVEVDRQTGHVSICRCASVAIEAVPDLAKGNPLGSKAAAMPASRRRYIIDALARHRKTIQAACSREPRHSGARSCANPWL
jgi:hypothetical protein